MPAQTNGVDPLQATEQLAHAINTYGIAFVLAVFIAVLVYVLWRLFGRNDGILTTVGKKHIEFLEASISRDKTQSDVLKRLASTAEGAHEISAARVRALKALVERQGQSIEVIERIGEHAVEVVEQVCKKLEIDDITAPSTNALRRQFETLRSHQNHDPIEIP